MILAVLLLPSDAALRRRSLLDQVFGAAAARIGAADVLKCCLFKPAREHAQPAKLHRDFAGEVMRRAENFHAHSFDSGRRGILVEIAQEVLNFKPDYSAPRFHPPHYNLPRECSARKTKWRVIIVHGRQKALPRDNLWLAKFPRLVVATPQKLA